VPANLCLQCRRRCLRRDVDGPIHRLTWQRSAPGRRASGSRSGRPARDRCRRGASNGAECGDRPSGAHGRPGRSRERNHRPQIRERDRNRRTRAPQGGPGTPAGVSEARRGFQGGPLSEGLPDRHGAGPGLPMRRPRTRRTSLPPPGGRGKETARARSEGIGNREDRDLTSLPSLQLPLLATHDTLFATRHSPFAIRHSPFATPPFAIASRRHACRRTRRDPRPAGTGAFDR
jgi:hypothetical protein